ncbi:MAG: hypothetical protein NZ889_02970 [Candidatus Pacearchaeota archaeon]|nr:hypothetical protein [Candidatus Pacearchaeota archaeon]
MSELRLDILLNNWEKEIIEKVEKDIKCPHPSSIGKFYYCNKKPDENIINKKIENWELLVFCTKYYEKCKFYQS